MNRRYCYCKEPQADTSLVPKCLNCGYFITFHYEMYGKQKMDAPYFQRQIKGLILIMQDHANDDVMVSREYIIEKLTMMLNGGINFHPGIIKHLDYLEGKENEKDKKV